MGKKLKLLHYLLIYISINTFPVYAQELSDNDRYDFLDAEYYYDIQDFEKAIKLYLKIIKRHPENVNFNYVTGRCYLSMPGEEKDALTYLEKAVTNIDEKYSSGSPRNTGAPPDAWLLYGDALHRENQLEKASYAYYQYKSYVENNTSALEMINQRIRGLGISYEASLRPPHIEIANLGSPVNTENSEYNPVFTSDGKTMFFTSYQEPKDKIYVTNMTGGLWSEPKDITTQLGSKGEFFTAAVSPDGSKLYCINYDQRNSDIFVSENSKGKWSKLQPLEGKINSSFHETSICMTSDGNTAYFSSDRSGGYGGFDLYYSVLEGDSWSKPVNMGSIINTKGDETSPRLSNDGNILYFSSDGFETIGKQDIQFTKKDKNGNWEIPANLGFPYNTVDDDDGFYFSNNLDTAYIARVLSDGMGKKDIIAITDLGPVVEPEPEFKPEPEFESESFAENLPESDIPVELIPDNNTTSEKVNNDDLEYISEMVEEEIKAEEQEHTESETFEEMLQVVEPIIQVPQEQEFTFYSTGKEFTIQLMALVFPKESDKFLQIDKNKIKSTLGDDGYTRYTYSEFRTLEEAQSELKGIIKYGFSDAFIRKTSEISNY